MLALWAASSGIGSIREIYRRAAPASLSDGSLARILVAVLIAVVALCWVRDEDRSRRLVQIIRAWRVGRARTTRADAKTPGGGRSQTTAAASPPGLPSRGIGERVIKRVVTRSAVSSA